MSSVIYFIEIEGFVKIGTSRDAIRRLRQISGSSPFEPKLLGVMSGHEGDELELHKKFARDHAKNEWFRLSGEIREFIESNCRILIVPKISSEPRWKVGVTVGDNDPYYCLQFYTKESAREKMRKEINNRLEENRKREEAQMQEATQ